MLTQSLTTKLWHNSDHVFKQFSSIGDTISRLLVKANITSFERILSLNPSQINMITNKNPPFGTRLIETVKNLPTFMIEFKKIQCSLDSCVVDIACVMANYEHMSSAVQHDSVSFLPKFHFVLGDGMNTLLCSARLK